MIPINKKYPIEELLKACEYFIEKTNRKITFEYALIKDVNSSLNDAVKLGQLLKHMLCNVNLIPINIVEGTDNIKPNKNQINLFKRTLEKEGIECTIREEKGADISAACGQLRGKR
jgi:23S rRNA (adenine2503-C2)-methyltransferase